MNLSHISKLILGILIISISAQLTIDVGEIPITGQTLSILLLAFFYKPLDVFFVVFGYLILGVLGLPIFADGESGLDKILGGSGGFLIGFVISSTIISYLSQSAKSKGWLNIFFLTSLGTIIILAFGVGRLSMMYGLEKGIEYGFTPFWKGAVIKILIGSSIVYLIRSWIHTGKDQIISG